MSNASACPGHTSPSQETTISNGHGVNCIFEEVGDVVDDDERAMERLQCEKTARIASRLSDSNREKMVVKQI